MKKVLFWAAFVLALSSLRPIYVYARSGCCSYHGGVCGCGCCDGSPLSDTCAPYYPECSQPVYIAPIATKTPVVYTPKPATQKPTVVPTPTLTSRPTTTTTSSPTSEPEVKSASTETQPTSSSPPEEATNPKDVILGLGILTVIAVGSIWLVKSIIRKFVCVIKRAWR